MSLYILDICLDFARLPSNQLVAGLKLTSIVTLVPLSFSECEEVVRSMSLARFPLENVTTQQTNKHTCRRATVEIFLRIIALQSYNIDPADSKEFLVDADHLYSNVLTHD